MAEMLAGRIVGAPYVVALMTAAARVGPGANVFEIGTGSGCQAAVLTKLGARVATIEIVPELAASDEAPRDTIVFATSWSGMATATGVGCGRSQRWSASPVSTV